MRIILIFFYITLSSIAFAQVPTLVYPKNNQVLSDSIIKFKWNGNPYSVQQSAFRIQISLDSSFSTLIKDSADILDKYVSLNGFSNFSKYYWRAGYKMNNQWVWSQYYNYQYFNPILEDSCVIWFDIEYGLEFDSLNRINKWISKSKFDTIYQLIDSLKPIYYHNDNLSYIKFNGNQYLLGKPSTSYLRNYNSSNFIIIKPYTTEYLIAISFSKPGINSFVSLEFEIRKNKSVIWRGSHNPFAYGTFTKDFSSFISNSTLLSFINKGDDSVYIYKNSILEKNGKLAYLSSNYQTLGVGCRQNFSGTYGLFFKGEINQIMIINKNYNLNDKFCIEKVLLNKITPQVNINYDIPNRYSFCNHTLQTQAKYQSYLWSTGDTTRSISISYKDTGWYWCQVPNLYGEMMRDSLYVYNFIPELKPQDTTVCLGTQSSISLPFEASRYNFLWSNASTNDSLITDQPGDYWLKVSDTLGCYIMDTVHVYVDSFAVEASLGTDKNVCTGEKISLETANNKAVNYLWSDNTTDSLLTINAAGNYSLAVSDIHGCLAKDTIYVSIHGYTPTVGFSTDSVCHTQSMLFQDTSSTPDASNIIQWEWDFGDGSSPIIKTTNQLISHLYPDTGNFTIRLKVTTDSACANYVYKNSYVKPLPKPLFSPNQVCLNEEIQFNNLSVSDFGTITAYRWLFGDGDSSAFPQPKHQYAISGNKSVKLIATTEYNCVDSTLLIVKVKDVPEVKFSSDTICFGKTTSFVDQSTSILSNPIYQRMWYFSPYDSSQLINPQFWFNAPGSFPVKLRVKAMNGCSDTLVKNVYVASLPKANFILPTFCYGATHTILDSSFIAADQVQRYIWSIDSIPYSTSQNIELSFKDTLYHKAKLWISTNHNCTDTISKSFKVHSIPKPAFTYDKEYGLPPLLVNFYNQSQNADNYIWNFGDGSVLVSQASIQAIAHVYTDSAIMEPVLYAIDLNNCSDSSKGLINVVYVKTDLSMEAIEAKLNGNYITFTCVVKNTGKQKIKKIDFKANYNGQFPMLESWEGILMPNQSMDYTFKAKAYASSPEEIKYYCFRANISGDQTDENPKNDELCKEYNVSYWLGSPYPNPVYDKLSLDLILDDPADCSISISDINGKIIWTTTAYFIKGLNQYNVSTANLPAGQYYLKLKFDDKEEVRVFVK